MVVKIPYTKSARLRNYVRRHWWQIAVVVTFSIIMAISVKEVGQRILKNYYIGIREADERYLVPVHNPLNASETFSLYIRMSSATFAAQTWTHTSIVLYPSEDYTRPVTPLNNSLYPDTYYVIFQGSQCKDQPDSNFVVGASCVFPLILAENGTQYYSPLNDKGEERTVYYNFEGTYDVLFAAKQDGKWVFSNSTHNDIIRVVPAEVVYNISYSKLTLFVTALAIEIAFFGTIIAIIFRKH